MKYLLLMYANESGLPATPEAQRAALPLWQTMVKEAETAGVLISNQGLASIANATTVHVRDGKTLATDGPFAETHAQLGGYFLLECRDLEEALRWAEKIPTAKYGSIEIRPVWSQSVSTA